VSEAGTAEGGAKPVSNWNVPNVLTTLRIVLVPFFGWALLAQGGDNAKLRLVAFAIFFVAMVTDKVDGDLARKHNLITNFGKIADPIADKAITGMAFVGLSIIGEVWWWVTIVVLVREWSITFIRLLVVSKIVLAADLVGKWKTFIQGIALGGLVLPLRDPDAASWWGTPGDVLHWAFEICLAVAVALTIWAGAQFFWSIWTQRDKLRRSPSQPA
jgi:CDP-diacylglycerol---glycerol-3-phosphate 3-phosphatidyltransferase